MKYKINGNKKGFTLIELLAVIIILAVIALITIPLVLNIVDASKKRSLEVIKKNMEKAAQAYVISNLEDFEINEGEKRYIQLPTLEQKHLKKVVNPYGKTKCEGYVKVEYENKKYGYTAFLDCGEGNALVVDSNYVNFGGNYLDTFTKVIKTSDGGFIALGNSNSEIVDEMDTFGNDINYDAIIVKYDSKGNILWSDVFGGTGHDYFRDVIEEGNYYVVLGDSTSKDNDLNGATSTSTSTSTVFVTKYTKNGINRKTHLLKSSSEVTASSIVSDGTNYYVSAYGRDLTTVNKYGKLTHIIKYDSNFNEIWIKNYGGTYGSNNYEMILLSNGNLLVANNVESNDGDVQDIVVSAQGVMSSTIFEISSNDGSIVGRGIFGGTGADAFRSLVEVSDGYIAVGHSGSKDVHMAGRNLGAGDAIIVKFTKTTNSNGLFSIVWSSVFGGSQSDAFYDVTYDGINLAAVGFSKSKDNHMGSIANSISGYNNAIVAKYDMSGNLIKANAVAGSNHDSLESIVSSDNRYVVVGTAFSLDGDIEPFNFGNSDAILMKLDSNLKPIKEFRLRTLVKSKLPDLITNYGTSIPSVSNKDNLKLYTTNEPTKELKHWCGTYGANDPYGNYDYAICLQPFNPSDKLTLLYSAHSTQNNISINNVSNKNNWLRLHFSYGNTRNATMSNLKIRFEGKDFVTIKQAVDLGYIEPLVISGGSRPKDIYFFENSYNLLSGGSSGVGNYPHVYILFKPKNLRLVCISYDSVATTSADGVLEVNEYNNFDISLTKSEKES